MTSETVKSGVFDFCSFLNITSDAFLLNKIKNEDELIEQAISLFKDDPHLFSNYLKKIFDLKVRYSLKQNYDELDFSDNSNIGEILSSIARIKILEAETGLYFPRPILTKTSFIFHLLLLLGPAILIGIALLFNVEIFMVMFGVVKIGFILFLLTVPYAIGYLVFPKFFQESKFRDVNTYSDLIGQLVLINRPFYMENDYALTRQEIRIFLAS